MGNKQPMENRDIKAEAYRLSRDYGMRKGRRIYLESNDTDKMLDIAILLARRSQSVYFMEILLKDRELLEGLSRIEHEQWTHWTRYMLDNYGDQNRRRWYQEILTSYSDLTEKQKQSDRNWAIKALKEVVKALGDTSRWKCRYCGCSDDRACVGGCYWVAPNLCSRCMKE